MKTFKLNLILTALCIASVAQAHEQEKHLIIVTVNTKEIFDKSLRGKNIIKKLGDEETATKAAFAPMQTTLQSKKSALEQLQNSYNEKIKSLEAKSKMISEEAKNKELEALQNLRNQAEEAAIDFERHGKKFNEEAKRAEQRFEALYKKEMIAFQTEVNEVIESAQIQHGWDIVHPREALLGASSKTDRTQIIIDELDKAEVKRKEAKQADKKTTPTAIKKIA